MRIMLVVPEYPPNTIGGGGVVFDALARGYRDAGHRVTVVFGDFTIRQHLSSLRRSYENNIRYFCVPEVPYPKHMPYFRSAMPALPAAIRQVAQVIGSESPDIVHAHGYGLPFIMQVVALAKKVGIPYIFTIHGYPEHPNRNPFVRSAWELFARFKIRPLLEGAQKVTCVSRSIREDPRNSTESNSVTIRNGIDTAGSIRHHRCRAQLLNELGMSDDDVFIFSIGRLNFSKGFQNVIALLPHLRNRSIRFKYVVAGNDDGYLSGLRNLARRLGVADEVLFIGWLDDDQKVDYYHAADIVAIPSLTEPFGIVALEALLFKRPGVPIVTSFSGGLSEVLSDYSLAFELNDLDVAIEKARLAWKGVIDDDSGQILERYDWHSIIREYLDILASCVENYREPTS